MKTEEIAHIARVAATLARINPPLKAQVWTVGNDVSALIKGAALLHRTAENECNYGLSTRQETVRSRTVKKMETIAGLYQRKIEAPIDCRSGSGAKLIGSDFELYL